jgi:hypothetical protein
MGKCGDIIDKNGSDLQAPLQGEAMVFPAMLFVKTFHENVLFFPQKQLKHK